MCAEQQNTTDSTRVFRDEARRWQAVQDRDAAADGLFVYAVKTTKIYCRPICKARLARRANVSFYDTGRAAHEAGFRACKRCRPELAGGMPEELAVRKIRAFVDGWRDGEGGGGDGNGDGDGDGDATNADRNLRQRRRQRLSLSQMARQTGLSKWHFHRVFKRCVGVTPSEFLRSGEKETESWSPPTSGTVSPWTDADLDLVLGLLPMDQEEKKQGCPDTTGFALCGVESALMPLSEDGLGWDDANLSFDDFLVWPDWPEEAAKSA
ncbi:Bifunctional transcriptional activator/DNA repair enzyme Ada [Beauveria bassiana D1-5]|uniref:Bifunctional transcriptional activator/DNA repair enzyme Ada n=1 Tax=Beauveria bassiana D1-5 TaxID=1245745 RepID=A0A0A2VEB5_BEABA|nr:Bifunctional transcriptional activator/DNA repair enzyme Ada [Beauveria bassiana D1-5]